MPGYRAHLSGATVFYMGYLGSLMLLFSIDRAYLHFSPVELVMYALVTFALCLMFGLWPDVDTNSRAQTVFYTLFFLADVVLIFSKHFQEAAYLGLFAILPVLGKHRGWTHTWWAMLLVPLPFLLLPFIFMPSRPLFGLPFYGAAVTGYFSHLFLDRVSTRFRRRRRRWMNL